jgi:hypothetical protein
MLWFPYIIEHCKPPNKGRVAHLVRRFAPGVHESGHYLLIEAACGWATSKGEAISWGDPDPGTFDIECPDCEEHYLKAMKK